MITFTNVIYDKVITTLEVLLKAEFPSFKINYDEHSAGQSFLLLPSADNLEELGAIGQVRSYTVNVSYRTKAENKKVYRVLSEVAERVRRLVDNNVVYSSGSTWFEAKIDSITYEEEEGYFYANMIFICNVMDAR